ncbi:MAG: hypothetical protein RJQ08_13670 [Salinisphaeraceae bacterium]
MKFLDLVQMAARESGTVSGNQPSTVVNQTGRLGKFVNWTQTAWTAIQNRRNAWRWMQAEFEDDTTAGSARYTSSSWNLDRWGEWLYGGDLVTLYKVSEGVSDEGVILYLPWHDYRRTYDRGVQNQDRPLHYAISPDGEFCLGPKPDATYRVRGMYRKSPQALAANDDVPEMPARFHEAIAWHALMLMAEHDEAELHIQTANRRFYDIIGTLERDQLPQTIIGGPLA